MYSLLEVFNVYIPLIYSEGEENTFKRLQEEINKASRVGPLRHSSRRVLDNAEHQQLASASGDRTVKIWDPATGQCVSTLTGHSNLVGSVA